MGDKLQRNQSTLKLMRSSGTGKLMRASLYGEDCDECTPALWTTGHTPRYYTAVFSGVILCPEEGWPNGVNLNAIWRLTQSPIAIEGTTYSCVWDYEDDNWLIRLSLYLPPEDICPAAYGSLTATGKPGGNYFLAQCKDTCIRAATYNNDLLIACNAVLQKAYGGTGQYCENWNPGGC